MNELTYNQVILVLDCYRGYGSERHLGTLGRDIVELKGLNIITDNPDKCGFKYLLTEDGVTLAKHLLAEATWKRVFTPGSVA